MVQDNQSLIGEHVAEKFGNKLPFLFKVLSVGKALSIQAHPNKKLAEQLHRHDPKNYPDDNHKPEMTIAITEFDGLCGFRPLNEIAQFFRTIPSLRKLVGEDEAQIFETTVRKQGSPSNAGHLAQNKRALQRTFRSLMSHADDEKIIKAACQGLLAQAEKEGADFAGGGVEATDGTFLSKEVKRLNGQFPDDIGLFVFFFLNYVHLKPGEAMFLKADDIHAYLSGDIIECMAASDNVVRAGFTPKFKDTKTLVDMLTYSFAPIEQQKMEPGPYNYAHTNGAGAQSSITLYNPPIAEFSVVKLDHHKKGANAYFDGLQGPSIVICTSGTGSIFLNGREKDTKKEMKAGYVYFVGATTEIVLQSDNDEQFTCFKAFCELEGEEESGKL